MFNLIATLCSLAFSFVTELLEVSAISDLFAPLRNQFARNRNIALLENPHRSSDVSRKIPGKWLRAILSSYFPF